MKPKWGESGLNEMYGFYKRFFSPRPKNILIDKNSLRIERLNEKVTSPSRKIRKKQPRFCDDQWSKKLQQRN